MLLFFQRSLKCLNPVTTVPLQCALLLAFGQIPRSVLMHFVLRSRLNISCIRWLRGEYFCIIGTQHLEENILNTQHSTLLVLQYIFTGAKGKREFNAFYV